MKNWYEDVFSPLIHVLSRGDGERAYTMGAWALKQISQSPILLEQTHRIYGAEDNTLQRCMDRICVRSPVGISAGLIKSLDKAAALEAAGYAFCEVGGVTLHPQEGNPRPRLHVLRKERAIINRMGFNNLGTAALARELELWKRGKAFPYLEGDMRIWPNIGLSKKTAERWDLQEIINEYGESITILFPFTDVIVLTISSPNTHNLRALQHRLLFGDFVSGILEYVSRKYNPATKTILIKFAPTPDWEHEEREEAIYTALSLGINGFVISNTTRHRFHLPETSAKLEGGLSGKLLYSTTLQNVEQVRIATIRAGKPDAIIVASGGLGFEPCSSLLALVAGATFVELNTAIRFRGLGVGIEQIRYIQRHQPIGRSARLLNVSPTSTHLSV